MPDVARRGAANGRAEARILRWRRRTVVVMPPPCLRRFYSRVPGALLGRTSRRRRSGSTPSPLAPPGRGTRDRPLWVFRGRAAQRGCSRGIGSEGWVSRRVGGGAFDVPWGHHECDAPVGENPELLGFP